MAHPVNRRQMPGWKQVRRPVRGPAPHPSGRKVGNPFNQKGRPGPKSGR